MATLASGSSRHSTVKGISPCRACLLLCVSGFELLLLGFLLFELRRLAEVGRAEARLARRSTVMDEPTSSRQGDREMRPLYNQINDVILMSKKMKKRPVIVGGGLCGVDSVKEGNREGLPAPSTSKLLGSPSIPLL